MSNPTIPKTFQCRSCDAAHEITDSVILAVVSANEIVPLLCPTCAANLSQEDRNSFVRSFLQAEK